MTSADGLGARPAERLERLGVSADEYYSTAVSSNRGLVSPEEQERLRRATVAIAGQGGLGGTCTIPLVRMGIGKLHLADSDEFSISNVHRQEAAMSSTIGRSKAQTMRELVEDIHPSCQVRCFTDGVTEENVDSFLDGADAVVDAIDFFCLPAHRMLHRRARERGLAVVISIPMGFGATLVVFGPGGMSFDNYFDFQDDDEPFDTLLKFLIGAVPTAFHAKYMEFGKASVADRRSVGIASAVRLCASLVSTEIVALLLDRGTVRFAPNYFAFDPYVKGFQRGVLRWGNRGPLQRLRLLAARRQFASQRDAANRLW